MKKGLLVLLVLLFATSAYAEVSFSISGDMFERGNYWRNQDYYTAGVFTPGHTTQKFMDGAIHLYPKIKVDNATINLKVTMLDQIWQNKNGTAGVATPTPAAGSASSKLDDNVAIERAWLTYAFTDKSILDVGLMDGSIWGSTFADNLAAKYRVKFTQKTDVGTFVGVYEKGAEESSPVKSATDNSDDTTNWAVGCITKAGPITIKPLLFLVNNSSNGSALPAAFKSTYFALELSGDLGALAFDSEFGYKTWEFTAASADTYDDATTWGAYINLFKALDFGKPGFIATYGSWDNRSGKKNGSNNFGWGFNSGNDFKSNLIFGGKGVDSTNLVSIPLGTNATDFDYAGSDLDAFTMLKPYIADIKPMPNLSVSASGSYMFSNQKDNQWDGAKAYEIDLGAAYKLSNNVTYSVDAGYGKLRFSTWANHNVGVENPDAVYAIQHMIKLVF